MYDEDDEDDYDSIPCPNCGEFVFEDSPRCPSCGEYIIDTRSGAFSGHSKWMQIVFVIIVLLTIFSFVLPSLLGILAR